MDETVKADRWQRVIRLGRLILAGLLLVWLGWQVIANTAADTQARSDPRAALAWRSDSAAALVALAEEQLAAAKTEQDIASVGELAERALLARPLDEPGLRALALAADLQGKPDRADVLMSLAGDRSLRDTGAQVWLFNRRIQEAKVSEALRHADAVLRTRPDLSGQFLNALVLLAGEGTSRQALVDVLATDPPWRLWFLRELPRRGSSAAVAYAILADLESTRQPPRIGELLPYLNQLIGAGQFELAFLAWMHFLPPDQSNALPYVFNGDFSLPVTGLPFDWTISSVKGATTDIVDTGDKDLGRALRVIFSNTRVPYRHVGKLLVLPPGAYELTGLVKADSLVNERGMVWRVTCAEGEKQLLGASDPVVGATAWIDFAAKFEIPSSHCRAQWLRLELAARLPIEEHVAGAIWYDRLAIRRADLSAVDPPAAN